MKATGLFGGTFNPIHLGHLHAAQAVKEQFHLDKMILIPSALPPHKTPVGIADARDRMEMTRIAIADLAGFSVSDLELKRKGPSYTIDTVYHFEQTSPADVQHYFILGLDAFLEIDTWKSYRALFQQIAFIVMNRPGVGDTSGAETWKVAGEHLKAVVSEGYRFSTSRSCFVHAENPPVHIADVAPLDTSSTEIRHRIGKDRSIQSLVPEGVDRYIKKQGLYR
ncbi:MAG: nicotinate-nucleotide adenylyltransferase [Desulfobacterales bacterium]